MPTRCWEDKSCFACQERFQCMVTMMNSYFDQSGFYNGGTQSQGSMGTAAAEQSYRFPQGLIVPSASCPQPGSRVVDSNTYDANANSKLYSSPMVAECMAAVKDHHHQNGYSNMNKDTGSMTSWANTNPLTAGLRSGMGADPAMMRSSFPTSTMSDHVAAAARVSDVWSTCCQNSGGPPPHPNSFYPWMALAGS